MDGLDGVGAGNVILEEELTEQNEEINNIELISKDQLTQLFLDH